MARNYHQGKWRPTHPEKYVGDVNSISYRSSWELKFMRWCDNNPSVTKWCSEELVIPYWSRADGKERRYFTDFVVQFTNRDGSTQTVIIEIKPESQTKPPVKGRKKTKTYIKECYDWQVNQDKWDAVKEYADKNGMTFRVLTEHELGIVK